MIISLSVKERRLPFDDQRGAVQMIKNMCEPVDIHTNLDAHPNNFGFSRNVFCLSMIILSSSIPFLSGST